MSLKRQKIQVPFSPRELRLLGIYLDVVSAYHRDPAIRSIADRVYSALRGHFKFSKFNPVNFKKSA